MEQPIFDLANVVRHDTPVPYYFQLASCIEQEIKAKHLLPGQLMSSEQEISEKARDKPERCPLGDRAPGAQRAYHQAEAESPAQFAIPPTTAVSCKICGASMNTPVRRYKRPTTRVLELKVHPTEAEVAEALQLNEGEPVILLNRLRFLDGEPEVLVVTYSRK